MQRTLLKSKIHRATVTGADLNYEGSVTIDRGLLEAADMVIYEQVDIYDITSGERITTYTLPGDRGSGEVCINGAAAHRVHEGDLVIIASYAIYDELEVGDHKPKIILVDARNRPRQPLAAAATH